ncbi:MAG: tetratricopeptide repeat protein [Leptolyngbyaceae cyanobacterium SM1_3_5]|nr:tetratricopeptide repeat protein [Leptolyngbyaceae cyanobacterium SM1_3_5]
MKSADLGVSQVRLKVNRGGWFLVGVPIATAVLLATQTNGLLPAAPVDPQYRYPYSETLSQLSPIARIEQEIATYQQRLRNSQSAIDQAALATAYLKMARMTGAGNWYLLADRTAQASLTKLPYDNVEAQIALARVAEAQHDFARSLQLAAQLPEADAIALQTTAYLATGKLLQANVAADRLVDATLGTNAFTLQAIVQLAQGEDDAALQSFQQAIAVEEPGELSSSAQVRTLLGRYYAERGDLDRADALYREALRILPNSPQAKLNLAQIELRRGHYRQADRLYAEITQSAQGNATVFDPLILARSCPN